MNQAIQEGIESYFIPKTDSDIDLILLVRDILAECGLANKLTDCYDKDSFIIEAQNKKTEVQKYLLNRYWHRQLMNAKVSSIDVRTYLIPNGEIEDWIKLFRFKIIPFILENNLPIVANNV